MDNRTRTPESLLLLCAVQPLCKTMSSEPCIDSLRTKTMSSEPCIYSLRPKYARVPTPMRPPMTVAYVPTWIGLVPLIYRHSTSVSTIIRVSLNTCIPQISHLPNSIMHLVTLTKALLSNCSERLQWVLQCIRLAQRAHITQQPNPTLTHTGKLGDLGSGYDK